MNLQDIHQYKLYHRATKIDALWLRDDSTTDGCRTVVGWTVGRRQGSGYGHFPQQKSQPNNSQIGCYWLGKRAIEDGP